MCPPREKWSDRTADSAAIVLPLAPDTDGPHPKGPAKLVLPLPLEGDEHSYPHNAVFMPAHYYLQCGDRELMKGGGS